MPVTHILLLIFGILALVPNAQTLFVNVPDCPSLYKYDFSGPSDQPVPRCYCDNATAANDREVQVNCLSTSTLRDVSRALDRIALHKKNFTTTQLHVENGIFNPEGVPDDFLAQRQVRDLEVVTIRNCNFEWPASSLFISRNAFRGCEKTIQQLQISECPLNFDVENVIGTLSRLESLQLKHVGHFTIRNLLVYQNLSSLDLTGNQLNDLDINITNIPISISELMLAENQLTFVTLESIRNLTSLTRLDLSSNSIDRLNSKTLIRLTKLKWLNLADNQLVALPGNSISNLSQLEYLDLSYNRINKSVEGLMKNLNNLTILLLSVNYIDDQTLEKLALPRKNLRHLDLSYNELTKFDANELISLENLNLANNEKLTIINDLESLRAIKVLNLTHTNLTGFFNTGNLERMEILDFSNTKITDLKETSFANTTGLKTLGLSSTLLKTLPRGIFDRLKSLEHVDLSKNSWSCDKDLLSWFPKWLLDQYNQGAIKDEAIGTTACSEPAIHAGKLLIKFADENFQLLTTTHRSTMSSTLATGSQNMTMLSVILPTTNESADFLVGWTTQKIPTSVFPDEKIAQQVKSTTIIVAVVVVSACILTVVGLLVSVAYVKRRRALKVISPRSSSTVNDLEMKSQAAL